MSLISRIPSNHAVIARRDLYLDDLSRDGFVLQPQAPLSAQAPAFYNHVWRRADLAFAKSPVITGHIDPATLTSNLWNFKLGTFVIKPAHSDMVYVPSELQQFLPFIQASIDNEFAANKNALGRKALLLLESATAETGKPYRPFAQDIHGHPPYRNERRLPFDVKNTKGILNTHYYFATNRNPTLFCTQNIDITDIDATGFRISNADFQYKCDFQAKPGDITLFTSVHAHQTSLEEGPNSEPRVLAGVCFLDEKANAEEGRPNPMLGHIVSLRMCGRPDEKIHDLIGVWKQRAAATLAL